MPFTFTRLALPDVILIEPKAYGDARGFFMETFKESEFRSAGICDHFSQDNQSRSCRGVLRGLHYQLPPSAQAKLVRCAAGELFDVVVDVRRSSPTFGRCVSAMLTAANRHILYVPFGFAHGICIVSETADVLYKASGEYCPALERGVRWDDPAIGIQWPLDGMTPSLSGKDAVCPLLADAEVFP